MDTKIKSAKTFSEDEMTVKEFLAYLKTKYIANLNGRPFTVNYAHSLLNYGRMPRHYGGNILEVKRVRGIKTVKILPELYIFYERDKDYVIPTGGVNKI